MVLFLLWNAVCQGADAVYCFVSGHRINRDAYVCAEHILWQDGGHNGWYIFCGFISCIRESASMEGMGKFYFTVFLNGSDFAVWKGI